MLRMVIHSVVHTAVHAHTQAPWWMVAPIMLVLLAVMVLPMVIWRVREVRAGR